jgi:hypothetical protein
MKAYGIVALAAALSLAACGGGGEPTAAQASAQAQAEVLMRPLAQALQAQPQAAAAVAPDSGTAMLRVYQALYGGAPSYNEYAFRSSFDTSGSTFASQYAADFSGMSDDALATQVLGNLGISLQSVNASAYTALQFALTQMFAAYGRSARGQIVANLANLLAGLESNATYGGAARSFNTQVSSNASYANSPSNTTSTRRTTGSTSSSSGGTSSYQSAYNACYVGTPALYSSTYCQAYANAIVAGAGAAAANQAGADAARSNVGNIGMGGTVSSVGTPNPNVSGSSGSSGGASGSSAPSYNSAYAECYNGTPALYSTTYCSAYATARASGQSASAANLAGATAANSNVGNVGTGQTITATGTPRSGSTGSGSTSGTSSGSTSGSTSGSSSGSGSSGGDLNAARQCQNQTYLGGWDNDQYDSYARLAQFDACLHRAGFNEYDSEGRSVCNILAQLVRETRSTMRTTYCPYPY